MDRTDIEKIRSGCRFFGINSRSDALWMDEFQFEGFKFDVLVVDMCSWLVRGFEIKMTRSDFLSDKKWVNYLTYVNLFYFATLPGIIKPSELPSEVGLLELSDDGLNPGLTMVKRAKSLQPVFVRQTFGEHLVTKILIKHARNINWRESRITASCEKCGHEARIKDGRYTGYGSYID